MSDAPIVVKVKKLVPHATIPTFARSGDAGCDLTCTSVDEGQYIYTYHTGLAMEIPVGYVAFLFPRSSIYKTDLTLANCVGVIDSSYRGEWIAKMRVEQIVTFDGGRAMPVVYSVGDRFLQVVIQKTFNPYFIEVEELSETERGEGGFGSTGS